MYQKVIDFHKTAFKIVFLNFNRHLKNFVLNHIGTYIIISNEYTLIFYYKHAYILLLFFKLI